MFVVVGDLLATEVAHGSAAGAVHQVAALRLEESEEIIFSRSDHHVVCVYRSIGKTGSTVTK